MISLSPSLNIPIIARSLSSHVNSIWTILFDVLFINAVIAFNAERVLLSYFFA